MVLQQLRYINQQIVVVEKRPTYDETYRLAGYYGERKPTYDENFTIDETMDPKDVIYQTYSRDKSSTVKYYNNTLIEAIDEKRKVTITRYLSDYGVGCLKLILAYIEIEAEQAEKDSADFGKEMAKATYMNPTGGYGIRC